MENIIPVYTVDESDIWRFDLEMEDSGIVQNISKTVYQTFGRYARTNTSKNNYASSSFTCLFGEVSNGQYIEESDKLDAWSEFINNGRPKLLKDMKGNAFIIDVADSNVKPNVKLKEIPSTLTFSWVQIDTAERTGFVSYN